VCFQQLPQNKKIRAFSVNSAENQASSLRTHEKTKQRRLRLMNGGGDDDVFFNNNRQRQLTFQQRRRAFGDSTSMSEARARSRRKATWLDICEKCALESRFSAIDVESALRMSGTLL
jgi:hypothetical protein